MQQTIKTEQVILKGRHAIKLNLLILLCMILLGTLLFRVADAAAQIKAAQKLEELTKTALRVDHESEGVIYISVDKQSYAVDTEILFVRPRGSRIEMVATGKVGTEQKIGGKKFLLIQLNRDSVVKYPKAGDFAVMMADPTAAYADEKKDNSNFLKPENDHAEKAIRDPGYIEAGFGLALGSLKTATSDTDPLFPTNGAKNPKAYRFSHLHFAYFSEFVPLGIEYASHWGVYPTSTYFANTVKTETNVSEIALYYRFKKFLGNKLRISPKLTYLSDSFKTDNDDKSLLTTKTSGFGLGARFSYDIRTDVWKPIQGDWPIILQKIYGDFVYYPFLNSKDEGVSRGTDSPGSTGTQVKLGATALIYLNFIPIVKRFVLDGGYAIRSYNLKFSGTPIQDQAGSQAIPVGLNNKETDSYYYFFFGIRFEDPLFMLRNTKYEKN